MYLGNGDGTFTAQKNIRGAGGQVVLTGDFNGDGKLDVMVNNPGVFLSLGKGDGTFEAAIYVGVTGTPLATGDFNGDGKLDFVGLYGSMPTLVTPYLGNGDGTFQRGTGIYPVYTPVLSLLAADMNGDGKVDIVTGGGSVRGGWVDVYHGNGDGTFQSAVHFNTQSTVTALASADFNGDGRPDLAALGNDSNVISILAGQADGSLGTPVNFPVQIGPVALVVADMNHDGKKDIAVVNSGFEFGDGAGERFAVGEGDLLGAWALK